MWPTWRAKWLPSWGLSRHTHDVFVAVLLHEIGKVGFGDDMLTTAIVNLTANSTFTGGGIPRVRSSCSRRCPT